MKRLAAVLGALLALFSVSLRTDDSLPENVLRKLSVDVSAGREIQRLETHGGFHGDGLTLAAWVLPDESAAAQMQKDARWRPLPMDDTARTLAYGLSDDRGRTGPFLCDGQGKSLLPDIQNGFYVLIDRNAGKEGDVLHRSSLNVTLALYDADTKILYYCALDT